MQLEQIGNEIRQMRLARGLTQAELAGKANLTRTTINRLENGLVNDLGFRKIQAVLKQLGLELITQSDAYPQTRDYLRLASTMASVSFESPLSDHELLRALLSGRVARRHQPHFRVLFEEAAPALVKGLIDQVGQWMKPGRLQKNLAKIAGAIGLPGKEKQWTMRG